MSASLLRGKLVVITGAALGIGRATATLLARSGALLSLADINREKLNSLKSELVGQNRNASHILTSIVDLRSAQACVNWMSETVAHFGEPVWGAANLAGIVGPSICQDKGTVRNMSEAEFNLVMDSNLRSTFNSLKAELPHMKIGHGGRDGGSLVNVASIAGVMGVARNRAYVAAKHGIVGLTRTVAKEEGERAIRVNAIAPGIIATPMLSEIEQYMGTTNLFGATDPGALVRRGDPKEAAQLVAYLLSPASSFVNGVVIPLDGGWAC